MDWFKFHTIWGDGLLELSDAEAGRFVKAICEYAETGTTQAQAGNERFLLSIALKQMKQDAERNAKISSVRAEAGRVGGLSSKQMQANEANACKEKQTETESSKCSIKNKELRIQNKETRIKNKNTEQELNKLVPNGTNGEKQALKPDAPEYWQRAFGPEADRAQRFSTVSGIVPLRNEFGRWQKELRQFSEANISIDIMVKAVEEMKKKSLTIGAPGSCFKIARDLSVKQNVPEVDYLDGVTWEGMDE